MQYLDKYFFFKLLILFFQANQKNVWESLEALASIYSILNDNYSAKRALEQATTYYHSYCKIKNIKSNKSIDKRLALKKDSLEQPGKIILDKELTPINDANKENSSLNVKKTHARRVSFSDTQKFIEIKNDLSITEQRLSDSKNKNLNTVVPVEAENNNENGISNLADDKARKENNLEDDKPKQLDLNDSYESEEDANNLSFEKGEEESEDDDDESEEDQESDKEKGKDIVINNNQVKEEKANLEKIENINLKAKEEPPKLP